VSRERKKQEMTEAIIDTAKRLFAEHGIEAVSMHMIAQELEIGQGTLYRRFANKAELCFAMLRTDFEELHSNVMDYMKENADASGYVKGKFIIGELITMNAKHKGWFEVMSSQMDLKSMHPEHIGQVPPPFLVLQSMIAPIFAEHTTQDPFAQSLITAWCLNPILIRVFQERGYSEEEIVEHFAEMFFKELK
jgi:AcrR family transcriptional regulator